jgi:hypothetical protein
VAGVLQIQSVYQVNYRLWIFAFGQNQQKLRLYCPVTGDIDSDTVVVSQRLWWFQVRPRRSHCHACCMSRGGDAKLGGRAEGGAKSWGPALLLAAASSREVQPLSRPVEQGIGSEHGSEPRTWSQSESWLCKAQHQHVRKSFRPSCCACRAGRSARPAKPCSIETIIKYLKASLLLLLFVLQFSL